MGRIAKFAKSALCAGLKYSGLARLQEAVARWGGDQRLPIVLFHRVADLPRPDGLTVRVEHFRAMCRLFARSFRVVPLARVFELVRDRQALPARTLAITFDDCYHDNLAAAQTLAEHGLPATFFVPTAYVGTGHVFPWDRDLPRMANLTWDDVRAMQALGHEVGSHSVTHPDMGGIDRDQAERELTESKATIEAKLGRPCRLFAYPFGGVANWRPEWDALVERAGYLGAVSAHGGVVRPGCPPRLLPREAMPFFTDMVNLELHLAGVLDWTYALRRSVGAMPNPAREG